MNFPKRVEIKNLQFAKQDGLIPVIVQDSRSLTILNLEYVNKEALKRTLETKYTHYYNQTKKQVVMKGETSGNIQRVIEILVDCDQDALIFQVEKKGLACQVWMKTCFHNRLEEFKKLRSGKKR